MEPITKSQFDGLVLKSEKPVIVDFYADWCGPCRKMLPLFEELAGEMDGADFFKVNVDNDGELAAEYGVRSIPTLIIFKDGKRVEELHGLQDKATLRQKLEQA